MQRVQYDNTYILNADEYISALMFPLSLLLSSFLLEFEILNVVEHIYEMTSGTEN